MELSDEAKREIEKLVIKATDKVMQHAFDHARDTLKAVAQRVAQMHDQAVALHSVAALKAINGTEDIPKK